MTDISPELRKAMNEVEAALSPLPEGYRIEASDSGTAIIVACKYPEPDGLGFAITAMTIADGRHVDDAIAHFGLLMHAVETGGRSDGANTSFIQ